MTRDPVCRRIEKSQALWAEYIATVHTDEPPLRTPGHEAWEAAQETALNSWAEAFESMVSATPQTAAGGVRLIDAFLSTEAELLAREHDQILALLRGLRRLLKRLT